MLDYLDSLEPLTDNNIYQCIQLQELTIRARSIPKELIYEQLSEYLVDVLPPKTSARPRCRTPAARLLMRKPVNEKEGVLGHTTDLLKI